MAYQTLTQAEIQPSILNPRKAFNDKTIEELAQSIKTDGLLQNLVVLKPKEKNKKYSILAGERGFRAISHLIEKGDLPKDFLISVEIKENLSEDEALRISMVENIQRENLAPLEEANALASLVKNGEKLDDIVAQTGLSVATIRRRLMLLQLSDAVKDALNAQQITLSQAEALAIGKHEAQDEALDEILGGYISSTDDIKDTMVGNLPTLSMAIFPKEMYSGDFTRDLLSEDNRTYFNDVDQFLDLQKQAAESLVTQYTETHDWAELQQGYSFHSWEYSEAEDGQKGGVVVFLSNNGDVSVHEGLVKSEADATTTTMIKGKAKAFYPTPLVRYISHQKSVAVQASLLQNPRKVRELAVSKKLSTFKAHACLDYFAAEQINPIGLRILNAVAQDLMPSLGLSSIENMADWAVLAHSFYVDAEGAYEVVQTLTDKELDYLSSFLEVCEFGQSFCDRLDGDANSLFNRITIDLGVDMRDYWIPDAGFLKRRTTFQLQQIIQQSGASARIGNASNYKKAELVTALTKYFLNAKNAQEPTDSEKQAASWLPEAMDFPAIDPDRTDRSSECEADGLSDDDQSDDDVE